MPRECWCCPQQRCLAGCWCRLCPPLPPCLPTFGIYACPNLQVKSHEYTKRTNAIVEALPPEEIPRVRTFQPAGSFVPRKRAMAISSSNAVWCCFPFSDRPQT